MDFYLTSKSLKQINESGLPENFKIHIFEETIKCNIFVSLFVSKQISDQYRVDSTIEEFNISFPPTSTFYSSHTELKNMLQRTNFITKFKQILTGSPIHFCTENETTNPITEEEKNNDKETAELLIETGKIIQNHFTRIILSFIV